MHKDVLSTIARISPEGIPELSVQQVREHRDALRIVDVRRPDEFNAELGHIKGAAFCTLETDLEIVLPKLSRQETYVFVCRSGGRSAQATAFAKAQGFEKVFNMMGGMLAWNSAGFEIER